MTLGMRAGRKRVRANGQRDGVGKTRLPRSAFEHGRSMLDPTRVSPYRPAADDMPQSMRPDTRQHLTAYIEPSQRKACICGGVHTRPHTRPPTRGRTCSNGDGGSWTIGRPTSNGNPRRLSRSSDAAVMRGTRIVVAGVSCLAAACELSLRFRSPKG